MKSHARTPISDSLIELLDLTPVTDVIRIEAFVSGKYCWSYFRESVACILTNKKKEKER